MSWISHNPAQTRALARGFAKALAQLSVPVSAAVQPAMALALCGPLGAGKTFFAQAAAQALGLKAGALTSPTFVIAGEFALQNAGAFSRLVHADFYRVQTLEELEFAGLEDWLAPGTLLLAEWADRFPRALPPERLTLRFEIAGPARRRIQAGAETEAQFPQQVLAEWKKQCP